MEVMFLIIYVCNYNVFSVIDLYMVVLFNK